MNRRKIILFVILMTLTLCACSSKDKSDTETRRRTTEAVSDDGNTEAEKNTQKQTEDTKTPEETETVTEQGGNDVTATSGETESETASQGNAEAETSAQQGNTGSSSNETGTVTDADTSGYYENTDNYVYYSAVLHGFINNKGDIYRVVAEEIKYNFSQKAERIKSEWGDCAVYRVMNRENETWDWYYINKELKPVYLYSANNYYESDYSSHAEESYNIVSFNGRSVAYIDNKNMKSDAGDYFALNVGDLYIFDSLTGQKALVDTEVLGGLFSPDGSYLLYEKIGNYDYEEERYLSAIVKLNIGNPEQKEEILLVDALMGIMRNYYVLIADDGTVYVISGYINKNRFMYYLTEACVVNSVYIWKDEKLMPIIPEDEDAEYGCLYNQSLDEFLFWDELGVFYYKAGMDSAKYIPFADGNVSVPYYYKVTYSLNNDIETLNNTVFWKEDGIYLFKSASQSMVKIVDTVMCQEVVISADRDGSLIYSDNYGIYKIMNYDADLQISLLYATDESFEDIPEYTLDFSVLLVETDEGYVNVVNNKKIDEELYEDDDIFMLIPAKAVIYKDGALYRLSAGWNDRYRIADNVADVYLCGKDSEVLWMVYETEDGRGYLYDGTKSIELTWYNRKVASVEEMYLDVGVMEYHKKEYDISGNETASIVYDEQHKITSMWRYEYDDNSRRTLEKYYIGTELCETIQHVYDDDGRWEKETEYNRNQDVKSMTLYEYDDGGLLAKVTEYAANQEIRSVTVYARDDAGRLVRETLYDGYGNMNGYPTYYDYDEYGNIVERYKFNDITGERITEKKYTYIYTDGYLSAVITDNGYSRIKEVYDEQGRIIGYGHCDADGDWDYDYEIEEWEFTYDGLVSAYIYDGPYNYSYSKYRYDEFGNRTLWVRDDKIVMRFENIYE